MTTTIWTVLISATSLLVVGTGTLFTIRWQRRNATVARLGYAFERPRVVGIEADRDTGDDEAYETEIVLRNLSPFAIAREKFSGRPIEVRLNARVLQVLHVRSWPAEQVRPRMPVAGGKRVLIEPFPFGVDREVRVRVRTAEAPHDMGVQADAPEVDLRKIRWRSR
ncbi:hypothetical protein [Actinoplanes sp. NBRC 103695]|uniref:hypothetical protein n=1 Tax=Actinoplanes sp. NBRC 103695 TaxID=3032202 RepID=UPI00249FAA9A|nr:hypothetical protein [Actinoplanes sp. NBRC 103695]GLY98183.1 hypothetical protein Acsp02_54370 [Actinoplanes sp. NBRC 103695]